VDDRKSRI